MNTDAVICIRTTKFKNVRGRGNDRLKCIRVVENDVSIFKFLTVFQISVWRISDPILMDEIGIKIIA